MNTKPKVLGAAAALVATAALLSPTEALAVTYYLQATPITIADPNGGVGIPMWGYALCTGSGSGCGAATVPGPALTVPVGDSTLTVHLTNNLPAPTSLVINGLNKLMIPVWTDGSLGPRTALDQRVRSFDTEAAPSGQATYTWSSVTPGTYLYQSGTHPQVQVQMGLYGAATKDQAAGQAYTGAFYDHQATLLYSEIDPALHAAVEDGSYGTTGPTSTLNYHPKYFLINGKVYPDGPVIDPVGSGTPGGTTLLRFLNAGLTTHVPMIDGTHWTMVAEDGKPYPWKTHQYTALLSAAKTMDVLLTPDVGGAVYSILDRRLNLSNNGEENGGMLAFLQFAASGTPGGGGGGGGGGSPNAIPVTVDDSYAGVTGVGIRVAAAQGVLVNDTDSDNLPRPLRAVAVTEGPTVAGGKFTMNTNGSFVYTPLPNYSGSDSFVYQVTDGEAIVSGNVNITLTLPSAPAAAALDNFDRADANSLGSGSWSQVVSSVAAEPNLQVVTNQAKAVSIGLGGLAIWNTQFLSTQSAGFTSITSLSDSSALVLKATGGTDSVPANFVRVRCESGNVVVATMMGGSNVSIYVTQAAFPAAACATPGSLSARVDDKGIVTAFIGGLYVGGVQLPNVPAWQGPGKIGIQMQTLDATVDDFLGGSL